MHQPITYAYLETTNYCNLNCSFCNRNEVVKKLQHLPLDKWKIVLEKLKNHPISEAKLMGLGSYPALKICKMFKEYFRRLFNCGY